MQKAALDKMKAKPKGYFMGKEGNAVRCRRARAEKVCTALWYHEFQCNASIQPC